MCNVMKKDEYDKCFTIGTFFIYGNDGGRRTRPWKFTFCNKEEENVLKRSVLKWTVLNILKNYAGVAEKMSRSKICVQLN